MLSGHIKKDIYFSRKISFSSQLWKSEAVVIKWKEK